jgi:HEAT repeat protein
MRAMSSRGVTLARSLRIRPGEGGLVARVALVVAVLESARGFGEVGVDTLVLRRFGPDTLPQILPFLFIALGVTGLIIALAYGVALGRLPRVPLYVGILVAVAALVVVLRIGLVGGDLIVVGALWLTVYAAGGLSMTLYWTVAGATFDARQAKRLFPLLTGAAIAGFFIGTLGAGPLAGLAGVETLVVVEAGLLVVGALLIARLPRRLDPRRPRRAPGSIVEEMRAGFDHVRRSPLMSLVALAYVLLAILAFSVLNPFLVAASRAFPSDVEVATALGLLSAAVTATSFVVSITVANRLYARFGVSVGALLLPIVYLAGFALWMVQFTFATAAAVRFAQQVTQRGVSNAAWSAFFNTVPAERRAQVLAFIDGVPGQIGTILSGVLLLTVGRILAPEQLFPIGAVTAIVATVVALGIRRRYAGSLLQALRAGPAEQVLEGGPGIGTLVRDPSVAHALMAAIRAPEPGVREMAAALLPSVAAPGARQALIGAVNDDDARVRATAIRALAAGPNGVTAVDLGPAATDPHPAVRAALTVAMATRDEAIAHTLLDDPSAEVRAAAVETLSRRDVADGPALLAALDDEAAIVRQAAATALAQSNIVPPTALLAVLHDGAPRAQRAALRALDRIGERDPSIDAPVAAWALGRSRRAAVLRRARSALDKDAMAGDGTVDLLVHVLQTRQRRLEDDALDALAVLGAPDARGVIRRCLRSADADVRAQATEALDSVGDRRLASALIDLLEGGPGVETETADDALARLSDDADQWIRALARRSIQERGGTVDMATTARTLSDIDTMLLLRRVPLFEGLDAEDLQRIARASEERAFAADEPLMREGDVGDELVVLVDGTVRVVHVEPDGAERFLRRYEAGEHIGELAVLRERPRAATVVAEPGGVRGLVISGEALKAILHERPEAAMAMLATLAERISRQ